MSNWFPHHPSLPMGVAGSRRTGGPPMPAMPAYPGGQSMITGSPMSGLAAHGVPVGYTPGGHPMLMGGGAGGGVMPPQIQGMPGMPGMPNWMMAGQMPASGLFQPAAAVPPFDPSNQVYQQQQQG